MHFWEISVKSLFSLDTSEMKGGACGVREGIVLDRGRWDPFHKKIKKDEEGGKVRLFFHLFCAYVERRFFHNTVETES